VVARVAAARLSLTFDESVCQPECARQVKAPRRRKLRTSALLLPRREAGGKYSRPWWPSS